MAFGSKQAGSAPPEKLRKRLTWFGFEALSILINPSVCSSAF